MAVAQPLRERLSGLLDEAALAPVDSLGDYAVDGHLPRAVAFPSSEEQLASALAFASREGLSVVPRGSGSLSTLGNLPQSVDIVLATTGLEPLIDHRPGDLTVTVGAGVTLGVLRERLSASGQWLPLDPPLASQRTIGGILATDLSGPLSLSQGFARDLVIGMKVAGSDGKVTKSGGRVVKNVTGFDLAKLHIGALGTLGVILEVSFKVWPLPRADTTLVAGYGSLADAIAAVQELLASHAAPDAVEVVASAEKTTPCVAYLRFVGTSTGVKVRLEKASGMLRDSGATIIEALEGEPAAKAWQGLADFGWDAQGSDDILLRFGCPRSRVGELAAPVERLVARESDGYSLLAGPGRGALRCLLPGGLSPADAQAVTERCREMASSVGGYAVVERCAPAAKAGLDVWGPPGDAIELMKRVKDRMDPNHILNRGRYAGGI